MILAHAEKTSSKILTTDAEVAGTATQMLLHCISCVHSPRLVYIYKDNYTRGNLDQKRKQHRPSADDASMAEAAHGRVERAEQGEAHPANATPNVGPHLQLGCCRLKTRCESGFAIAETTWLTYLYIYLHIGVHHHFCTMSMTLCESVSCCAVRLSAT